MRIEERFIEAVKTYPENIALYSEQEGSITYNELDEYSNYIAGFIDRNINDTETFIGVLINRSFKMIAVLLGVMKAGKAYVPFDPMYPDERVKIMAKRSGVNIILTDFGERKPIDNVSFLPIENEEIQTSIYNNNCIKAEEACMLFTSGSSGTPDCVQLTHDSILNTLTWAIEFYKLSAQDIALQIPSCSFTSSVQDIFSTLLSGGALVVIQEDDLLNVKRLVKISKKYGVTHFDMVPSLYNEYLKYLDHSSLRFVLLAGEPLAVSLASRHYERMPEVTLVNEYGMAESSSCFSYFIVPDKVDKIFIGKPINNMSYFIDNVDDNKIGELVISGPGVAKGYYSNQELTNRKFVIHNGQRFFYTGDLVREREGGILEYIGRIDRQIKINGKRIELKEIENFLLKGDYVENCICTSMKIFEKEQIVLFYIGQKTENVIRNIIKKYFPEHYVPIYIKKKQKFDYLPNRKIDVKKLCEKAMSDISKSQQEFMDEEIIEMLKKYTIIDSNFSIDAELKCFIDSLKFIKFLSDIEVRYSKEFDYDEILQMKYISVRNILNILRN